MAIEASTDLAAGLERDRKRELQQVERRIDRQITTRRARQFLAEFPQARETQARLLEELRELGLLSPIETITGIQIPPMPTDEEDHLYYTEAGMKSGPRERISDFVLFMPTPTLNNRWGIWDDAAKIFVLRCPYENGQPRDPNAQGILALTLSSEHSVAVDKWNSHPLAWVKDEPARKQSLIDHIERSLSQSRGIEVAIAPDHRTGNPTVGNPIWLDSQDWIWRK